MESNLAELTDSLVKTYLGYRGGGFVIISDNSTTDIADSVYESAQKLKTRVEKRIRMINFDHWRNGAPLTYMPDGMRAALESGLDWADKDYNLVLSLKRSLDGEMPVMKEIMDLAESRGKMGGLPYCTLDVLEAAFNSQNNPDFGKELFDFISREECVSLTGENGTNLLVDINHKRFTTINSDGILIPGVYANPIPGEVYLHPENVNGTFVIDSSYGPLMGFGPFVGNYQALAATLAKHPIIWTIKQGKITDVACEDEQVQQFARREIFEKDAKQNGDRIGELGLPTNLYILGRGITGNMLIDEKGRVHLAHGYGYTKRTGCDYESNVHGDGLINKANLFAMKLGKQFMVDSVYSPDVFVSLRRGLTPHPQHEL